MSRSFSTWAGAKRRAVFPSYSALSPRCRNDAILAQLYAVACQLTICRPPIAVCRLERLADDGTTVGNSVGVASEVHAAMVELDPAVAPFSPHDRDGRSRARLVEVLGDEVGYVFSGARRTATGSPRAGGSRERESRSRRQEPARA